MATTGNGPSRIILIDDDPSFCRIMEQAARQRGVELNHFLSLADLGFVSLLGQYDVAILDYDLGNMTGVEIGEYLKAFFDHVPMLLVSSTLRQAKGGDVKAAHPFVHKKRGYDAVLSAALALIDNKTPGRHSLSQVVDLGAA